MEALIALVGALVGAGGVLLLEYYRRADDRRGVASAIAGEISGLLYSAENRKLPDAFRALVPKLRSDSPPPPPWAYFDQSVEPTPVLDAYIDRIGHLGGTLPSRVAYFYTLYAAIRLETKLIAVGKFDDRPAVAAARIENALDLWDQTSREARQLVNDLLALCGEQPIY